METSDQHVYHHTDKVEPEFKVKIERGQRGGYKWEITYSGLNWTHVLHEIDSIDSMLRNIYKRDEVATRDDDRD